MQYIKNWFGAVALLPLTAFSQVQAEILPALISPEKKNLLKENIECRIQAQFSIGGSTPLGLPREIREISSYNPNLQAGLEASVTIWPETQGPIGWRFALAVEGKGMRTSALVKNYLTGIIQDSAEIKGYFTGEVETAISNTYLTIPVLAVYDFSPDWNFYAGLYGSAAIAKSFTGYVSRGYLRQDTPAGAKISFDNGGRAVYDFSQEVRTFHFGNRFGSEYYINRNFIVFSDFTFGLNGILKSSFKSISFNLHNLYLNSGFGYKF